jgi:DNA polymerase-2
MKIMKNLDYSYIDAFEFKDSIVVWGRDVSGGLIVDKIPLQDYLYAYIKDNTGTSTMRDLYGTPMRKVAFDDKWSLRDWCKSRTGLCESDVPPVYKMLLEVFSEAPATAPYNTLLYDIEVDFDLEEGRGYPTPKNPYGEINLFQAFDASRNVYVMFMNERLQDTVKLQDKAFPVEVHYITGEADLLESVANYIQHIDIMCGWYTNGFDLPYIMERAIIHFGEKTAKSMFCRDGFMARRRDFVNDFGDDQWEWTLIGRQHMDMMELYKKFIPGEKTSFSLDAVCEADLGETKDDYEGDLGSLYRENPQKFCEYGLQDVRLLKKLDDKHQIVRLAVALARMNCVKFSDVSGSVKPIETGIMKYCHSIGVVLPDKTHNEKEKFPGAIVYDTIAGRHGWMFTIDLAGLYPSTMKMLGLSPETMMMQCADEYTDYVAIMTKSDKMVTVDLLLEGETVTVPAYELEAIIREQGYCISANGTIFSGEMGYLSKYVEYVVNLRAEYKKKMKEALAVGDKESYELYDLYQKVVKILANSVYGATGEASFRLYDIRLSKSITLTARIISKWQAYKANDYVNQLGGSN